MSALLAIGWSPELRGILIVIIAVVTLCGSIYMILGTNMGARLGFLVSLAGLAGWMFIMGAVWWTYGQGLLGTQASWQPVGNNTVIRVPGLLTDVGAVSDPIEVSGTNATSDAAEVSDQLRAGGWDKLDSALPAYQQAGSAGGVLLEESGAFAAGEFVVVSVYAKGGERWPILFDGKIDYLAFFHEPHYSLVEIAPLVPQRTEPGRAPARAVIDTERPHEYVYMIRDLGSKRVPAAIVTISSLIIFLLLCWMLHTRDRRVEENRSAKALPAKV
jgi:hypothetical protein